MPQVVDEVLVSFHFVLHLVIEDRMLEVVRAGSEYFLRVVFVADEMPWLFHFSVFTQLGHCVEVVLVSGCTTQGDAR